MVVVKERQIEVDQSEMGMDRHNERAKDPK